MLCCDALCYAIMQYATFQCLALSCNVLRYYASCDDAMLYVARCLLLSFNAFCYGTMPHGTLQCLMVRYDALWYAMVPYATLRCLYVTLQCLTLHYDALCYVIAPHTALWSLTHHPTTPSVTLQNLTHHTSSRYVTSKKKADTRRSKENAAELRVFVWRGAIALLPIMLTPWLLHFSLCLLLLKFCGATLGPEKKQRRKQVVYLAGSAVLGKREHDIFFWCFRHHYGCCCYCFCFCHCFCRCDRCCSRCDDNTRSHDEMHPRQRTRRRL